MESRQTLEELADRYEHDRSIVPDLHLSLDDLRDWKFSKEHISIGARFGEKFGRASGVRENGGQNAGFPVSARKRQ